MKTSNEMVTDLLRRRDQYLETQKKRRRRIAGITSSAACCALLVCTAFLMLPKEENHVTPPVPASPVQTENPAQPAEPTAAEPAESAEPTAAEPAKTVETEPAPATEPSGQSQVSPSDVSDGDSNGFCLFWWKNKLSMYGSLYWALENDPDGTFAATAVYRPVTGEITSFVYEGKTLAEWAIAAEDERFLPDKLTELLKFGDYLKYGEALYQTGAPDGTVWDKRLYEDKIAYYGEELLQKYIVDGAFLREDLERDIAAARSITTARDQYAKAFDAYLETVLPQAVTQLTENGIPCERMLSGTQKGLRLTVTAEQLENLPLADLTHWYFGLAEE